jgi:type IV pilus assembly protein PilM
MSAQAPIGLDIGSVSIRAVEVSRSKDRPVINNFAQAVQPEGAMVGGVVKDDRAVTSALRQLWASQKFRTKSVVLGVTHQQVVVREVEISNLPAKEMRQALPFQVRDVLPLPPEQAILDFYPLEDVTKKGEKKETVRGLLIAAPKEAVIDTVRAVERAGLHVTQVDLSCFAALRAAACSTPDTEAIIDLGANGTNIIIHTDGVPQIVRTIPRGGVEVTKLIAARLSISLTDAEALKCQIGMDGNDDPASAAVISEAMRPLLNEIRSSISYYTNAQSDRKVARLSLVGGASGLPGLTERLTSSLQIPAFVANPLQHVGDSRHGGRHDVLGRFRSSAAVCIGLTLGAA